MRALTNQERPSDKRFGLTFASALLALGIYGLAERRPTLYLTCLLAGALCGAAALAIPRSLAPLNSVWTRFGELLGKIVSPVALGIIFFGILSPVAIVMRLLGRDELRLRRRTSGSYWTSRAPRGDAMAQSFKNQF